MALATVLRAAFGYLFLVLIVRVVGRRPGKQLTPFEFVLIFYLGGLTWSRFATMRCLRCASVRIGSRSFSTACR